MLLFFGTIFTPWRLYFHSNSNGGMTRQWSGLLAIVFFLLGFLLYLRYQSHVLEYGSQKSPIAIHISTCFLVRFVFCCFLCFLICLFLLPLFHFFRRFHVLFFQFFMFCHCFICFSFVSFIFICSFVFIYLHILSFLSFPACSFYWKKHYQSRPFACRPTTSFCWKRKNHNPVRIHGAAKKMVCHGSHPNKAPLC